MPPDRMGPEGTVPKNLRDVEGHIWRGGTQTERKRNAAEEARSAGWLKTAPAPPKPIVSAPADSSALDGLTSDQKLALVLQEMAGLPRALADHTKVSADLKAFLMQGSGMISA